VNLFVKQNVAFVIGLDCFTGLQTARILSKYEIPVTGIATDPKHFCCKTRVCSEKVFCNTKNESLIETLCDLGPGLQAKGVLYPCHDIAVSLISRHREKLENWFHIALPSPQSVELLMDKYSFVKYAIKAGLPIPQTAFIRSNSEALKTADEMRYPCILKPPHKTLKWEKNCSEKVFRVETKAEFLEIYHRVKGWADLLMAQQWVEGTDADLFSCNCYFDSESKPVAHFVAKKMRQWPPRAGTSCLGIETRCDEVLRTTLDLFRRNKYFGLGYLEMKRNRADGKYYIIEPNIGRPTGRSAIAEAGGVEILYAMYCDLTGRERPKNLSQRYTGVKWIYFRRDLQSAYYYWKKGELSIGQWIQSIRGKKAWALFSPDDPLPFFADFFRVIGISIGRKTKNSNSAAPAHPVIKKNEKWAKI